MIYLVCFLVVWEVLSQKEHFVDNCKYEVPTMLCGSAGSRYWYFRRIKLPSASSCTVTVEGWTTPDIKQVLGGLNRPSDTCFSLLQTQGDSNSEKHASAELLSWRIQAVVFEELISKAVVWPEAYTVPYLCTRWLQYQFGFDHGLGPVFEKQGGGTPSFTECLLRSQKALLPIVCTSDGITLIVSFFTYTELHISYQWY